MVRQRPQASSEGAQDVHPRQRHLDVGGGELWAIEMKRSTAPSVSRGFHSACDDLRPARKFVVHPGADDFPMGRGIEAVSLGSMTRRLSEAA